MTGKRDKYVEVHRATTTLSESGEPVTTWGTYCKRWAEITDLSGTELWRAQQAQSQVSVLVTMPRDSQTRQLDSGTRVVHGDRTLEVLTVLHKDRRDAEIELLCKEASE